MQRNVELRCTDKLSASTDHVHLAGRSTQMAISISQRTATRDWHFALITCGEVAQTTLKLKLQADRGARSIFQANSQFDESSCPVMPADWWRVAAVQAGFWVMLSLVMYFGCIGGLQIPLCRRHCRKAKKLSKPASNVVVGKPCALPENAEIVEGQPNQDGKVPV